MAEQRLNVQEPWFLRERANAFAKLMLTSHNDVKVQNYAGRDMAINLLVEVIKDGTTTLRYFGVQLKGYLDLPDLENERAFSHLGSDPFEAALPLCAFVIGVRKPEGVYRWTVEPVVEDGRALLHRDVKTDWQPLDEAGAARLIAQVNAWYDALNGNGTPKPRGRHAKAS
jgi:hypothetical protein